MWCWGGTNKSKRVGRSFVKLSVFKLVAVITSLKEGSGLH